MQKEEFTSEVNQKREEEQTEMVIQEGLLWLRRLTIHTKFLFTKFHKNYTQINQNFIFYQPLTNNFKPLSNKMCSMLMIYS